MRFTMDPIVSSDVLDKKCGIIKDNIEYHKKKARTLKIFQSPALIQHRSRKLIGATHHENEGRTEYPQT